MAEICVNIPEDWKAEMQSSGIDPSLVIRVLLKKELQDRARLRSIISKSELTEEDVQEISEKIDKSLSRKFKQSLE